MNVGGPHFTDGFEDEPVSPYDRQACESFSNDVHGEVPPSVRRTDVPGMKVAVVNDLEFEGLQRRAQSFIEPVGARNGRFVGHGNTLMNGRTSHDSKTPPVT